MSPDRPQLDDASSAEEDANTLATVAPTLLKDGWRVRVVSEGHIDFLEAESIEFNVFSELGYTESTTGSCNEYLPWRGRSRFALVEDGSGGVHGLVRMIAGSFNELPVAKMPNRFDENGSACLEYASLAVLPGDRGTGVAEALYRAVWLEATRLKVEWLAAIVDPWMFDLLVGHYGFPFKVVGPQTPYMGGDVLPIVASMRDVSATLPVTRPLIWQWFYEGLIEQGLVPTSNSEPSELDLRDSQRFTG